EAIAALEKAVEVAPWWKGALAVGYARTGQEGPARELLAEIEAGPVSPWDAYWLAAVHAWLGDADAALRWLDHGHPHAWVPWVRVLDLFEPLWDDPRFVEVLERMNLPPRRG
ncbi:MAG: hypothetical protein R3244_10505, partial [Thermoanaerobaculia bacterium]|nr:hypothetical protein [Thermoanaerobaculia bacterium]